MSDAYHDADKKWCAMHQTEYRHECPHCYSQFKKSYEKHNSIDDLKKQLAELDKYFTSGNEIPVERATILAKDYWKIRGKE